MNEREQFKLVPVEPTEEQIQAGCVSQSTNDAISYEVWAATHSNEIVKKIRGWVTSDYKAMLEAAPSQPAQEPVYQVKHGELCYKSEHDDQSFGMWIPVNEQHKPKYAHETKFYATKQSETQEAQEPVYIIISGSDEIEVSKVRYDAWTSAKYVSHTQTSEAARIAELEAKLAESIALLIEADSEISWQAGASTEKEVKVIRKKIADFLAIADKG